MRDEDLGQILSDNDRTLGFRQFGERSKCSVRFLKGWWPVLCCRLGRRVVYFFLALSRALLRKRSELTGSPGSTTRFGYNRVRLDGREIPVDRSIDEVGDELVGEDLMRDGRILRGEFLEMRGM